MVPRRTRPRATWTTEDEMALLRFLSEYKTYARDTVRFLSQRPTWYAAAAKMKCYRSQGGAKTPMACKAKWQQLKKTYRVVDAITHRFSFSWNDKLGASIDTRLQDIWNVYVQDHPEAKPFRNTGWPHYERMRDLMRMPHRPNENDVENVTENDQYASLPRSEVPSESDSWNAYEEEALLLAGQAAYMVVMAAVAMSDSMSSRLDSTSGLSGTA